MADTFCTGERSKKVEGNNQDVINTDTDSRLLPYQYMDKMFPYFMSIGMSFEEYWNGDPYLAQYYLKAQEIRERQKNTWLWLEGEYVFAAFSTALSNFHLDGKQHELNNYMQEPLQIFPETEQQIAQKEERKREELADRLRQMAKQFKDRNGEKNG